MGSPAAEEGEDQERRLLLRRDQLEIEGTVRWLLKNKTCRVALQVPDYMLHEAAFISHHITTTYKEEVSKVQGGSLAGADSLSSSSSFDPSALKVFVMADTIDGSCHVDEITAQHLTADCVIHYGAIYIPHVANLPVRFVLDKSDVDVEDLISKLASGLEEELKKVEDKQTPHGAAAKKRRKIVVTYELKYEHAMKEVQQRLRESEECMALCKHFDFVFAKLSLKEQSKPGSGGGVTSGNTNTNTTDDDDDDVVVVVERPDQQPTTSKTRVHKIGGLEWTLKEQEEEGGDGSGRNSDCDNDDGDGDVRYVWIGEENLTFTNFMLVYNQVSWFQYLPSSKTWHSDVSNTSRTLKRRYFLVEKAKDASIVGIVVGTMSIAGYMEALEALREMISRAGKKSYTFVMGRITPEKLANYPEIDVFVLISCPQLALLDSREYYAPVVTPFEAELAFVPGKSWTGQYSIGFDSLLGTCTSGRRSGEEEEEEEEEKEGNKNGEEEPSFSLIKGEYRQGNTSKIDINIIQQTDNLQLSQVRNKELYDVESAADYMTKIRTYTGIETPQSGAEVKEPAAAKVGRSGRAAGYNEGKGLDEADRHGEKDP